MAYVIYNKETTKLLRVYKNGMWQDVRVLTEAAAKASLTRYAKKDPTFVPADWAIASQEDFASIEKTVLVKNLMSGEMVAQRANTPLSCDVSSETYWSI